MEVLLNLAWAALAVALVAAWLRGGGRTHSNRRGQIVAIAVLIAILFPVISVSDDLMAVQSSSETDNCLRRDHLLPSSAHPLLPGTAMAPPAALTGITLSFLRYVSPRWTLTDYVQASEKAPIQNRPPPEA